MTPILIAVGGTLVYMACCSWFPRWDGRRSVFPREAEGKHRKRPGRRTTGRKRKSTGTTTYLTVDLAEPLERVEGILEEELPKIHEKLCEISGSEVGGPKYRGVSKITESGVVLSFSIYCKGMYYGWLQRMLNRELKLMCERRDIRIAMNQMVLHGETENGQEREEEP